MKLYAADDWAVAFGDIEPEPCRTLQAELVDQGHQVNFFRHDVTKVEDWQQVHSELEKLWSGLDLLINNAGAAVCGRTEDVPLDDWRHAMEVNFFGPVCGSQVLLPLLKNGALTAGASSAKLERSRIINVASLMGLINPPYMAPYSASKAALIAWTQSVAAEWQTSAVDISVVCPSFFISNLMSSARSTDALLVSSAKVKMKGSKDSVVAIAKAIKSGGETGAAMIVPGLEAKGMMLLRRLLPQSTFRRLLRYLVLRQNRLAAGHQDWGRN